MNNDVFDNEEETFEDELLPVALPVATTLPVALPVATPVEFPPSISAASSFNSQFDPFAPEQSSSSDNNNNIHQGDLLEDFQDEVGVAASNNSNNNSNSSDGFDFLLSETTTPPPERIGGSPVLIPMHPDADGDLLGGASVVPKHASKAVKDPKTKHIIYDDDDVDVGMDLLTSKAEDDKDSDNFVDDDNDDDNADTGGFFSRLRNKASGAVSSNNTETSASAIPDDARSNKMEINLEDGGNSLPHPDTLKGKSSRDTLHDANESESESEISEEDGLERNGMSLPHPEEVLRSTTTSDAAKEREPEELLLDENGMSLPHPDEVLRSTTTSDPAKEREPEELLLDENRMSLPHPDEVLRSTPNQSMVVLDENGMSLPHPDEVLRSTKSNTNAATKDEPEELPLDENGMSLPHPESVIRYKSDNYTAPLNDTYLNTDSDSDSSNGNSDNDRLMAALDAASNSLDSDEDMYVEDSSESENEEYKDSSNISVSSRSSDSNSMSNSIDSGTHLDKNGNSLPHPDEHGITSHSGHGPSSFRWGSLKKRLRSTFSKAKERDDSYEEDDGFDDEDGSGRFVGYRKGEDDEEMAYGGDYDSDAESDSESGSDSSDSEGDDFDDEASISAKDRLRALLKEHKDNPRSRLICLVLFLLVLLLVIIIPVATRRKKDAKTKTIDPNSPFAFPPPEVSFSEDTTCYDEIALTDENGNDLVNGTSTSDDAACFSMDEPIRFRFKRCRPASPLDWVGVFPARSLFMDRLWKDHYDGVYLCGDQPCPKDGPLNQKGGLPLFSSSLTVPPINIPGEYRIFLVKDSQWPYEPLDETPSFHVVEKKETCQNKDNIFDATKPSENDTGARSPFVDFSTEQPTKDDGETSAIGT